MKKFRFSLETLLKIRSEKIEQAGSKLLECAKNCQLIISELEEMTRLIQQTEVEMRERRKKGIFKYEKAFSKYLEMLKEKEKALRKEKEIHQRKLLSEQKQTTQAINERKIVAKLKEKKYALWEAEKEKEESLYK
jgi:flagellar FliJ protein